MNADYWSSLMLCGILNWREVFWMGVCLEEPDTEALELPLISS